jgi:hypothetical protein
MPRGGAREGAGRKIGAVSEATKRNQEITIRALAEGKSPLEVMLDNMRHFQQVALDAEATLEGLTVAEFTGTVNCETPEQQFKALLAHVKKTAGFRQMAQECARDAAAYMHPKLAAVEHTGANGGPIMIRASKEQRDAAVSAALRADTDT